MRSVSEGCTPFAIFHGGSETLALLARIFGFEYKTAHQESQECATHLTRITGHDHYVSVTCENMNVSAPPVVLTCYYRVLRGRKIL